MLKLWRFYLNRFVFNEILMTLIEMMPVAVPVLKYFNHFSVSLEIPISVPNSNI